MAAEAAAARGREEGGDGGGSGGRREGVRSRGDRGVGGWGVGGGARGRSEVGRVWHRHCVWALEPGLGQGPLRWGVGEAGEEPPDNRRDSRATEGPLRGGAPGERHAHG